MKAMIVREPGDETVLALDEVAEPELLPGSLRIRVVAAGVNRADLMQRQGHYPPPPGASDLLGLECAGEVLEVAAGVSGWQPGDRVMALLTGGGYAEQVVVDAGSVLPVPQHMDLEAAAAFPEVFLTVFLNCFQIGGLQSGDSLLVHGGGSGIGTAAIQLAHEGGVTSFVTAGSQEKLERCRELGADHAISYREEDFAERILAVSDGRGVDVVLDHMGAVYFESNLKALAVGGRLVIIGLMGGARSEINLASLLMRRQQVIGSTLRARPADQKAALVQAFLDRFGEALDQRRIAPVIDQVMPLAEAAEAHRRMKSSAHFGKLVLSVSS